MSAKRKTVDPVPTKSLHYVRDKSQTTDADPRFVLDFDATEGLLAFDRKTMSLHEIGAKERKGGKGSDMIVAHIPLPNGRFLRTNVLRQVYVPGGEDLATLPIPLPEEVVPTVEAPVASGGGADADGESADPLAVAERIAAKGKAFRPMLVAHLRSMDGVSKKAAEEMADAMLGE